MDVDLYYYSNPGQEAEQMVNLSGQAYRDLPTAFAYRTAYDTANACKKQVAGGGISLVALADGSNRAMISYGEATFPLPLRAAETRKPNVVLILIDDFGYADSGPYGAKDIRTPHMDRLAREGVRFTDFYANAPVCTPTRCGFITGRWQQRVGFEWAMGFTAEAFRRVDGRLVPEKDVHGLGLPTSVPTLPKLLKTAGYAAGAFGKWHLGYKDEYNPTKHGFDEYFGELLGHSDYDTRAYYDGTYALRDGMEPVRVEGYLTDLINRRAVEFVR